MPAALREVLKKELTAIDEAMGPLVQRRDAIQQLMTTYQGDLGRPQSVDGYELNSLDMAQNVIKMAGRPLSLDRIIADIFDTYKVTPAKTLYQMLYKRAKAAQTFYRTKEGEFGLLELMPEIRTVVESGNTAVA